MPKSKPSTSSIHVQQEGTRVPSGPSVSSDTQNLLEKDILLSLNNDISAISEKKDILKKIHPKLHQLFTIEDLFICVVDKSNETLDPFLRVASEKRRMFPDYEDTINSKFPIRDGFIDSILDSGKAVVYDIDEVNAWPNPPHYMKISKAAGLAQTLSKAMFHGEELLGIVTFWSDNKYAFTDHHIEMMNHVASQISIAVVNILANETIRQREKENEILLLISNQVAAIRNKEDLTRILSMSLKNHMQFDDACIVVYNKASNVYNVYAYSIEKKRSDHPEIQRALTTSYPASDNDLSNPHNPIVLSVETLSKSGKNAVSFIKEAGIKEIVSIKLIDGENLIGLFVLMSEQENIFTATSLNIMRRISYQISIAVAKLLAMEEIQDREREKDILLTIGNELASIRDKRDLLPLLKIQFERLGFYNDITIAKVDSNNRTFSSFLVNKDSNRADHSVYPEMRSAHHSFPDGVFEVALNAKEPVLFDLEEIVKRGNAPVYVKFLKETGTIEMVAVSLRDRNMEIGALFCFSTTKKSFTKRQLNLVQGIGNQLGTAVANILANEEIKDREYEKTILLSLSREVAAVRNKEDLFHVVNSKLKELFSIQGFGIGLINENEKTHSTFLLGVDPSIENHSDFHSQISGKFNINDGVFDRVLHSDDPVKLDVSALPDSDAIPPYARFWKSIGLQSVVGVALRVGDRNLGCLFFHLDPHHLDRLRNNLLKGVCSQISIALSNILANEKVNTQLMEINGYKEQLEKEKLYLQEEVSSGYTYSDIIGVCDEMQKVFHSLSQVSFTNSTVLILGETGTGKELIARAIHNSSTRKDKLMVKVNCASIPPNLIESELFGHEKGAFTGAMERRIGKFELAHNGTLFLDEIGELPLDLQSKLLRVLQEREIERVGGKTVIKTDVRIIAATNRNLEKEVHDGKFRRDLYYRLNVFPITIPPLRDRKKDIPLLASFFVTKFSKNSGKKIIKISGNVMTALTNYDWPGNVRELEHLIERYVLITQGNTIKEVHLPKGKGTSISSSETGVLKTFDDNERDHILYVLQKCNGKIYGQGGAAELLGLKVSTLNSKIKKLGIKKESYFDQEK